MSLQNLETSALTLGEQNGLLYLKTNGQSMLPFIKGGDSVVVSKESCVNNYDIVAFTRSDGMIVVHRVVASKNGKYNIKGDNTFYDEWVEPNMILGVVICRVHNGKNIDDFTSKRSKFIARLHNFYPIKRIFNLFYRFIFKLKRKRKQK